MATHHLDNEDHVVGGTTACTCWYCGIERKLEGMFVSRSVVHDPASEFFLGATGALVCSDMVWKVFLNALRDPKFAFVADEIVARVGYCTLRQVILSKLCVDGKRVHSLNTVFVLQSFLTHNVFKLLLVLCDPDDLGEKFDVGEFNRHQRGMLGHVVGQETVETIPGVKLYTLHKLQVLMAYVVNHSMFGGRVKVITPAAGDVAVA